MADIADILASVSGPTVSAAALDLQCLTRAWINERTAPALLPYPAALIARCTDAISRRLERIEYLTGSMDPGRNFEVVVLQTDLERAKYLVRSFLRARIAKIDKFPFYYLKESASLLSSLEAQYLNTHTALLHAHYSSAFLSTFTAPLQKLDDTGGGISMVDAPDEEAAVFCRVLRDGDSEGDDPIELKRGDVWVLRWRSVKGLVENGNVELI